MSNSDNEMSCSVHEESSYSDDPSNNAPEEIPSENPITPVVKEEPKPSAVIVLRPQVRRVPLPSVVAIVNSDPLT